MTTTKTTALTCRVCGTGLHGMTDAVRMKGTGEPPDALRCMRFVECTERAARNRRIEIDAPEPPRVMGGAA